MTLHLQNGMKLSTQLVMLVKLFHHSMRLSLIVDKLIPLKKLSRRQASFSLKPWITKGLRNSIKVKNHLYSKFLKTKSELYHAQYKHYRNKLQKLIPISKKYYYGDYFNHFNNDMKKTWKGIKQIISTKSSEFVAPSKIINDD